MRRTGLLAGYAALVATAAIAMGGMLWSFERLEAHRFTSVAILTGTFRLRSALADIQHDEQVHAGAGYTNWGFGVPLLQAPFHALHRFFPDRAIYFVYLAATIAVLWAALDRLVAARAPASLRRGRRLALSWSATFLVLSATVYPLMSYRFLVYEETVCYLLVFELLALCAYLFAQPSWRAGPVVLMALAAGVGLLVRPTGAVYLAVWGLLVALESRRLRATATFAAAAAPFVAFWLVTNWVKTGSPFGLGAASSLPFYSFDVRVERFGTQCADSPAHFVQAAARLFQGLFLWTPKPEGWMKSCHFDFETRIWDGRMYPAEGFLGPHVLIGLAVLLGIVLRRRGPRLAALVPFGAMGLLFFSFVALHAGFAWRYAGDFWPLVVLASAQCFRALPSSANHRLEPRLTMMVAACAAVTFVRHVVPAVHSIETLDDRAAGTINEDFLRARWGEDPPMRSRLQCGDPLDTPWDNGVGWAPGCAVDTFTNVFLGVPEKAGGHYSVRIDAPGMSADAVRVYVDGRYYIAHRQGDMYAADVEVDRASLHSPIVMATVLWTSGYDPPEGVLRSIEIL